MRLMAIACCLVALAQGQQAAKTSEDLCTLPPSSRPPLLPARLLPGQGRSHLTITTKSPEAQKFFDQGLAQMHNFSSYEAERSFLQAAQLDPEAAMPQWGIAMVAAGDYRPTFQLRDGGNRPGTRTPSPGLERARAAAEKARKLSDPATPLEKLYIAAVVARRNPEAKDAEAGYLQALRDLLRTYQKEVEAKSFLALGLMSGYAPPDKKPRAGTEESYTLLKEILAQDPDHVGAHHYVIHALEGSTHPQDAWASCKRYPELSPGVPHALHMPGHIYVQSDRWTDAAAAFEAAARKERELLAADQLYPNGHHGHNVHFLVTTYSFLGQYEEAMKNSGELLEIRENPREAKQAGNTRTPYRQGWFARMRTLVQFGKWEEILAGKLLPEYPVAREQAWRHWARGLAFAARGDAAQARAEAKSMDEQMKAWEKVSGSPAPQLEVARLELSGHVEMAAGHKKKGLDLLERAAMRELALPYNEPAAYPRPVWEAMGQAAWEARDRKRAETAFRRALEQNPGSSRARQGLGTTAAAGGGGE